MAPTFPFASFYGGASTSSKGCDSALSDKEWPPLNSVSTRSKGARPCVSPTNGKKAGKKGRSNLKRKSVDNVNISQDSEILSSSVLAECDEGNPLSDSVLGDVLDKGVTNESVLAQYEDSVNTTTNDSAFSVGNVLSNTLLNENMGVEDSLSNSDLMEALNANNPLNDSVLGDVLNKGVNSDSALSVEDDNHMSVDDVNTSQKTVELNVSAIEHLDQTPIKKRKRGGIASLRASGSSSGEDCSDDEFRVDDPDYVDDDDEYSPLNKNARRNKSTPKNDGKVKRGAGRPPGSKNKNPPGSKNVPKKIQEMARKVKQQVTR